MENTINPLHQFFAAIENKSVNHPLAIALFDFLNQIDYIYGTYLDALQGFHNNKEMLLRRHEIMKKKGWLPDNIMDVPYEYGVGAPDNPEHRSRRVSTQRNFIVRNDKMGRNAIILAQLVVIQIYQLWEDEYWERIAIQFDMKKDEFKQSLFGDLRTLRRSIIHNAGVAILEVNKNELFTWFKSGETLKFTDEHIETIVNYARGFILLILEKINPFTPFELR